MKKPNKKNRSIFGNLSSGLFLFRIFFFFFLFSKTLAIECPSGYWKCENGIQCINSTFRCNNIINCEDGSDEGTLCNTTCAINEFKCATGNECIRMNYVCDHDKDCSDGSDEHSNCTYPVCGYGTFTCANKRCINEYFLCDGDNDCLDNSDEKFCASRNCPPNQLACNTTGTCIDVQKFCNGIADCPDGSDESSTCSSVNCSSLSCTHGCKATPKGGICFCPQGQILDKSNNRICVDVNECEMWDECDQICVNLNNSYSCQCKENYTLKPDGHCSHIQSDLAKIIFSIGSKIFETNQQSQNFHQILNNDDLMISSFDYNYEKKLFYLADDKNNKIFKAIYGSNDQLELSPLITSNILAPFQLSVDWVTGNIYLLQKTLARIDVFSPDGKNRTNLLSSLFNPTSFALDPTEGLLFFTDSGFNSNKLKGPRIEKVLMDGRNRQVIVKEKLLEPIAITVDLIKKRLFWIDRKYDHLETSDYFGLKRYIIASGSKNLPHSVSLDLFESTIYFADYTKMAIMKLTRHAVTTASNVTYHFKTSEKPHFVRVYHQTKQPATENPCQSNCEHFCLLSHGRNSVKSFRCKCNNGFRLRHDLKTCDQIATSMFISQSNYLKAVALDSENTEALDPLIMPRNGALQVFALDITNNRTFFYDSYRHAIFQSINNQEPSVLIPNNVLYVNNLAYDWVSKNLYFVNNDQIVAVSLANVKNRRVLVQKQLLEGFAIDPSSGFMFYSSVSRPAKIFRSFLDGTNETVVIPRGLSLPYSLELDLEQKLLYWSDSHLSLIQYSDYHGGNIRTLLHSPLFVPFSILIFRHNLYFVDIRQDSIFRTSKTFALTPTLFRSNLKNVHALKISDLSLQMGFENHPCLRQNGDCSHFCFSVPSLDTQYKVSRHCGCPYGFMLDSRKLNCVVNSSEAQNENLCQPPYFFKCSNEKCVFKSEVCDGINDCLDMSDESNCPVSYCTNEQFKCRNGTCIEKSKRCDGKVDCGDFSDEIFCPQVNCDLNYQFKCNNGSCIPLSWK
ncbi:low-density lipo receptor-related 2 isoform X1, partial [Brachionus plicatilis]